MGWDDKLPNDWRAALAVVVVAGVAFVGLDARVRARAEEATDARMAQKWAVELRIEAVNAAVSVATEAATKAAAEAARSAVKQAVSDVVKDLEVHKAVQEERERATNDRLRTLEQKHAARARWIDDGAAARKE